jgi:hypothetical protein
LKINEAEFCCLIPEPDFMFLFLLADMRQDVSDVELRVDERLLGSAVKWAGCGD